MSINADLDMPKINLDSDQVFDQIREARMRLNTITWYLHARALEDFFKRWPDLESLTVENAGDAVEQIPYFKVGKWAQGADPIIPDDKQTRLDDALANLGGDICASDGQGIDAAIDAMFNAAHIPADQVMALFGNLWRNSQDDSIMAGTRWTVLLAEVGRSRLDGGVDQAKEETSKPLMRM